MNNQEHIIETFTEMAHRYEYLMNSELNRFWGINYRDFVDELINEIHFRKHDKILDIATGTAFIPQTISVENQKFNHIVGLDITFEMLFNAKKQITSRKLPKSINLVCSSAHAMPFQEGVFDITTCCLATHHMDIDLLMSQVYSALKTKGKFHLADVGGSRRWKIWIIRLIIKIAAFVYFLFAENLSRARAESEAVSNIYTATEWRDIIESHGFINVKLQELKSKRFWAPNPVIIEASKPTEEE